MMLMVDRNDVRDAGRTEWNKQCKCGFRTAGAELSAHAARTPVSRPKNRSVPRALRQTQKAGPEAIQNCNAFMNSLAFPHAFLIVSSLPLRTLQ
jgi:hypothetical protein